MYWSLKRTHLLQTIAVVPIQAFGVAQFGSMQKVSTLVFESNFHMILTEKAIPMIMASLFRLLELRTILAQVCLKMLSLNMPDLEQMDI